MEILVWVLVGLYILAMGFLFLYSLSQLSLVWKYWKGKKDYKNSQLKDDSFLPKVTIQLPIYNERYVAERLIDQVCKIDYPATKLEIQVLDDSTDETLQLAAKKIEEWQSKGIDIIHVLREGREGFKAGALKYGLTQAKGDFIAIFDSDFLPNKDFISKTIGHFKNPDVGVVQTRWGHINRNYSLLTELQGFALDAHFTVEQSGRNAIDSFINFNGTAGIWRKTCILDAGNWSADTLTEDLDLSYRAQLKGWNFIYLQDVISPSELPPVMSAVKTQQYRWNKGGAETAVKHLKAVFKSNKSPLVKWHGVMHLLNSSVFLSILICTILSVPIIYIKVHFPAVKEFFVLALVFLLSYVFLFTFYWSAVLSVNPNDKLKESLKFLYKFPLFLSVSMGLSLHNAIAVIEGYLGKKSSFIRTPKFNITQSSDSWRKNVYINKNLNFLNLLEAVLLLYFSFGLIYGWCIGDRSLLPLHLMLVIGYGTVLSYSIFQKNTI